MSGANAGGRKSRRSQDHMVIINGIIFEHARSSSKKQITIMIYDCEQCFDSLWHEEVTNDLYEAGVTNDKLSLLYKINQNNNVAVKTCQGLSQRKQVDHIICQGEPWGPIECSVQVDGIGKESLAEDLEPYTYKMRSRFQLLGGLMT